MNDIVLENVSKTFDDQIVWDKLSYTFHAGEIYCIEGSSGRGKTTLLQMIAGLIPPDSGTITGVPQRLAFVFQEDRLCEDFSARSNIRLVCGNSQSKEEIAAHLEELKLDTSSKKPVRTFSGGMKRRVSIARAICYDADCILLDEPFQGLDAELKHTVIDYVLRHTKGKTVLCVTHDASEAEYLGGIRIAFPQD